MNILFSSAPKKTIISPAEFNISCYGEQVFEINNITDIYGNPLIESTLTIETTVGRINGKSDILEIKLPSGTTNYTFSLASEKNEEEKTIVCPSNPENAMITVTVQLPDSEILNSTGGNGELASVNVIGTINN
jgi:hypothetical protein